MADNLKVPSSTPTPGSVSEGEIDMARWLENIEKTIQRVVTNPTRLACGSQVPADPWQCALEVSDETLRNAKKAQRAQQDRVSAAATAFLAALDQMKAEVRLGAELNHKFDKMAERNKTGTANRQLNKKDQITRRNEEHQKAVARKRARLDQAVGPTPAPPAA